MDTDWKYFFRSHRLLEKFRRNSARGRTVEWEAENRKNVELFIGATATQFDRIRALRLQKVGGFRECIVFMEDSL